MVGGFGAVHAGVDYARTSVRIDIRTKIVLRLVMTAGAICTSTGAQEAQRKPEDLADASLEDLMKVEVTTVSKKEQTLSRTAAAVFVIGQEDIERSGATNIPDLLRIVPGLNVAQINASTWAISARGLNGQFSNELLVLIDGRNVYTPAFGGVFWDTVDLPLENIERIEVIRGPGAALWGENAVNGVVNIIRKKAGDTKGGLVSTGAGNTDVDFMTLQYGASIKKKVDYRVYAKYFDNHDMRGNGGSEAGDGWHMLRGGFRTDSVLSDRDSLVVEGDIYTGREGNPTYALPSILSPGLVPVQDFVNVSGGYLESIWRHTWSGRSDFTLTGTYDTYERVDLLNDHRKTEGLDFKHHYELSERHELVWGATYHHTSDESAGGTWLSLIPPNQDENIFSVFVQDEIAAIQDKLYVTLGSKFENNTYSGFAAMPTVRAIYRVNRRQSVWTAISRAVRSPAETDVSLRANGGATTLPDGTVAAISAFGNPHIKDEELVAYEAGYRTMVTSRLSLDIAAYYNDYDNQISDEPGPAFVETTPPPTHLVLPTITKNLSHGEAHGVEAWLKWKARDRWTIDWSYDFERIHMHRETGSQDFSTGPETEGSAPHQQARVQSALDLRRDLAWNLSANFSDRLQAQNVPSYARLDTNLIWRIRQNLTFGVYGQNLLRDRHLEYFDPDGSSTRTTLVRRSGYVKLTWRF
jgi:iron complex outermembrane receptor protein